MFVKRLDLHTAFFKEKGISEVHMSCRYEENISGYQKLKVQKNQDRQNSHIKNHDVKNIVSWEVNEKIGDERVENERKSRNLEVGGTAAKSSDLANLPDEENGLFSEVFLVVFGFWWGPVGSRVGNPSPGDEDGVG